MRVLPLLLLLCTRCSRAQPGLISTFIGGFNATSVPVSHAEFAIDSGSRLVSDGAGGLLLSRHGCLRRIDAARANVTLLMGVCQQANDGLNGAPFIADGRVADNWTEPCHGGRAGRARGECDASSSRATIIRH